MAEIENEATLFCHLIESCHIPFNFDGDSWDDLAVETANRNYRGAVTTIFHPSFTWRRILQNIQRTITHFGSTYYQGTTLILERTFIIPVGREYFLKQTWEVAVPFHQHPEGRLQTLWPEYNWQAKIPPNHSVSYNAIRKKPYVYLKSSISL